MNENVRLREMRWWDIEPVLELEQKVFPEDPWTAGMFWSELAYARGPRRTRFYLVAERSDGTPAGYAGLAAAEGVGDVQSIAVAPSDRGAGLGTRLLAVLLAAAGSFGCQEVFLEVRTDNDRALRLYHRFGFEALGIRRAYYQPGDHDALVMRRRQTPEEPAEPSRPSRPGGPGESGESGEPRT